MANSSIIKMDDTKQLSMIRNKYGTIDKKLLKRIISSEIDYATSSNDSMMLSIYQLVDIELGKDIYSKLHTIVAKEYALILSERLGFEKYNRQLTIAMLLHDIAKNREGDKKDKTIKVDIGNITIQRELKKYINDNITNELNNICKPSKFGTHGLAAAIISQTQLNITDMNILIPIAMHSGQLYESYIDFDDDLKMLTDIVCLADKLSSNYIRINYMSKPLICDLDEIVFGLDGNEFNFINGLVYTRCIVMYAKGNVHDAMGSYYKSILDNGEFNVSDIIKEEDNKIWPKRKSKVLRISIPI